MPTDTTIEIPQPTPPTYATKLASDTNFVALDQHLRRFNIFDATDMVRREIKHTKFLAFLLDPKKPHGMGSKFIRAFLADIANDGDIPLLDMDLSSIEVKPEHKLKKKEDSSGGTIDILIQVRLRSNSKTPYIIAIENKLDAREGNNQLANYEATINTHHKNNNKLFIYLTDGSKEEISSKTWREITYQNNVLPILEKIIQSDDETTPDYLLSIIKDYRDLLTESDDSEADDHAGKIDDNLIQEFQTHFKIKSEEFGTEEWQLKIDHPAATNFLIKYKADKRIKLLKWFNKESISNLKNNSDIRIESSNRRLFRFGFLSNKHSSFIKNASKPDCVKSSINLWAEIVITPKTKGFLVHKKIVLGPTNEQCNFRNYLITNLCRELGYTGRRNPGENYAVIFSPANSIELPTIEDVKTSVINYMNSFNNENSPKKIIENTLDEFMKNSATQSNTTTQNQ